MIEEHHLRTFRDSVGSAFEAGMPHLPHFTLHGREHLDELDRLCQLFASAIPGFSSDAEQLGILKLAIIMHDFAMVDVPTREREAELRALMDPCLSFADVVRMTHQDEIVQSLEGKAQTLYDTFSGASIDEINDAIEVARYHRFHPLVSAPAHLRHLCALMRLLDELDIGPKRAPRAAYSSLRERMDPISRLHWLKHICCARIEQSRTLNHEISNGRHTLHLWVAVQATESSWRGIQCAILSKLLRCLHDDGVAALLLGKYGLNVVIEACPERASLCGAAAVLPPDVKADLEELSDQWASDGSDPCTEVDDAGMRQSASVASRHAASDDAESGSLRAVPALSERQLVIRAILPESLLQNLSRAGRLSVIGNRYVPRNEKSIGGVVGAASRIYLGPADCGKTRAAAEWIHELVGGHPAKWIVLRTDQGSIPQNIDENIILDTSCLVEGQGLPQNAVLFLDDLPGNLPPDSAGGESRDDATEAVRRLLAWFGQQPYFRERRLVGTIRQEEIHELPKWPEVLSSLGTELELVRLTELSEEDYAGLWQGMSRGIVFVSQDEGEKEFTLELQPAFVEAVAKRSTNPEGIAQYVFDAARRGETVLTAEDADSFRASAAQAWLIETWPALQNGYGTAARVFHTIARFLEGGLRQHSEFLGSLFPSWEYHSALGPGICEIAGEVGVDYIKKLDQIGRDGHAVGERGSWIRPRWDFLLQADELPGVVVGLPDSGWFASHSMNLSSKLRQQLALHLTAAGWDMTKSLVDDDSWLLGIADGKALLADRAASAEARLGLLDEWADLSRQATELNRDNSKAWASHGLAFIQKAKVTGVLKHRRSLLEESIESFRCAAEIEPDELETLKCWGGALSELAKTKAGAEADNLFAASYDKYEQSHAIKPDDHDVLKDWGTVLGEQAAMKTGERGDGLFAASYEKHEQALATSPNDHDVLKSWGVALYRHAMVKAGDEADRLFAASYEKYERALAIKPDDHKVLSNWGVALSQQAMVKAGQEADRLFETSCEKHERASAIKPDDHEVLNNWGVALYRHAMVKAGDEADRLFAASYEKYERALAIKPDDHEVLCNWGAMLSEQAAMKTGEEADALFELSLEKYEQASAIDPDDHVVCRSWGISLSRQAMVKVGEEADRLFAASYEKYEHALAIKPDDGVVFKSWGVSLFRQAMVKAGKEADRLFGAGYEKYEQALAIKPDDHEVLSNWGAALSQQAKTRTGDEANDLFSKARTKLIESEEVLAGSAAYNMACLSALLGDVKECAVYLRRADQYGTLPALEFVSSDEDFAGVRGTTEFQDLLRELYPEQ